MDDEEEAHDEDPGMGPRVMVEDHDARQVDVTTHCKTLDRLAAETPTGMIFDMQRFSVHDGPGIRTTVFLKSCPLRCAWCHNPEGQELEVEISFLPDRCIGCGSCFTICPNGCHILKNDTHVFLRDRCERCGLCTGECYAQALERVGKEVTVAEVVDEVMKDKPFYDTSGGGMTLSGGEPLAQREFSIALLREAKRRDLHTCVETCGHGSYGGLESMLRFVDILFYDFKESDPEKHREYTGVPNLRILENLQRLDAVGAVIFLRCPIIPGMNDRNEHFEAIADLANRTTSIRQIDVIPYHPLGKSKSERIGKEYPLPDESFTDDDEVNRWVAYIQERTEIPVKRS